MSTENNSVDKPSISNGQEDDKNSYLAQLFESMKHDVRNAIEAEEKRTRVSRFLLWTILGAAAGGIVSPVLNAVTGVSEGDTIVESLEQTINEIPNYKAMVQGAIIGVSFRHFGYIRGKKEAGKAVMDVVLNKPEEVVHHFLDSLSDQDKDRIAPLLLELGDHGRDEEE